MRIAICDDEEVQRKLLKKYLLEWGKERRNRVEITSYSSAESFLFHWEDDREFDLLVLDIEMGSISGMDMAVRLRENEEEIPILFVTGYDSYMAQGYEVSALHYLLKPVHKEKLFSVLDKLQKSKKVQEKIMLRMEEGNLAVAVPDIWYIEAAGHQCMLFAAGRQYTLRHSISEMKKMLSSQKEIVSCHRSYLVNLQHVSAIVKSEIIMDDSTRLPISRGAGKQVNEAFIRIYKE